MKVEFRRATSSPSGDHFSTFNNYWDASGIVRIPDISFISKQRLPKEKLSRTPIPQLVPDLAVEILSQSNSVPEMNLKLEQYFQAGVGAVWYIQPADQTATCYQSIKDAVTIDRTGYLQCQSILPGFELQLGWLFDQAEQSGA